MAELTTTNGTQYIFTPAAIVAVSDRDQTCILGLTAGVIQIGEPVATFLQRIGNPANFVRFQQGGGKFLWVRATAVSLIRPPLPHEWVETARTMVFIGSVSQGVLEDPNAVRAAINAVAPNHL